MRLFELLVFGLLLFCYPTFSFASKVIVIDPSIQLMLNRSDPIARRLTADLFLSRNRVAGIIANLAAESWLDPTVHQFRMPWAYGGVGIAQWTGDRRLKYQDFCRRIGLKPTSWEANIRFLELELETSQSQYLLAVRSSPDNPIAAASAFIGFENSSPWFRKIHLWDHERYARLIAAHLDISGGL